MLAQARPVPLDALICGAGPAGCAAARLLAAWGHRVLAVDRAASEAARLAESIPPSAQKVLAAIGALPAVEDASFVRWRGNTVWWAGEQPRVESFAAGAAGYQVERRHFDDVLRRLAVESGAEVRTGVVRAVRAAGLSGAPGSQETSVEKSDVEAEIECDGETITAHASFVLDCSGRAGVVARRGLRVPSGGPRTVALSGIWLAERGWQQDDDSHTLVASYEDGWAWSVPTAPGRRHFTVMVDPGRTGLVRGAPSREIYLAELAKVRPFAPVLSRGHLAEGPWGADATTYHASRYAGGAFLLVGDAGSTIDPLSSFGVKKALVSGWLAAIAVHTSLRHAPMRGEAFAFFDRRERALAASAERQAVQFAADAALRTAHPFWLARAEPPALLEDGDGPDPAALARDPDVMAAFEDLRRRPAVRFTRSDAAVVASRAAVRGHEIVLEEHLLLPGWPDGVRHLRGVDLVQLVELAPSFSDVGELYRAVVNTRPGVSLPDFLGALSVLIARGALVHAAVV